MYTAEIRERTFNESAIFPSRKKCESRATGRRQLSLMVLQLKKDIYPEKGELNLDRASEG